MSDVGLRIAAHFYNRNMQRHGGRLEAVLTGKVLNEEQRKCMVWDIERGVATDMHAAALADGHLHRRLALLASRARAARLQVGADGGADARRHREQEREPDAQRPAARLGRAGRRRALVRRRLRAVDEREQRAIYASRPWAVYGEGPSTQAQEPLRAQGFNEGRNKPYTAEDIRFVQKGGKVYAFALAWPENGKLTIKSLAAGSPHAPGQIERVELFTMGAPWGGAPGWRTSSSRAPPTDSSITLPRAAAGRVRVHARDLRARGW